MTEIDIDMPDRDRTEHASTRIERVLADHGLVLASQGTLKKYAGCIHWHVKRPGEKGTLEVTLWPKAQRVWFKVQAGRRAPWIDELTPVLKRALER